MKISKEVAVFKAFSASYPDALDANSIRQVKPPKPDLECDLKTGGTIAFELVEILDEGIARRLSFLNLRTEIDTQIKRMSQPNRDLLKKLYPGCFIQLDFNKDTTDTKRRKIIGSLLNYLIKNPLGHGSHMPENVGISRVINRVRVAIIKGSKEPPRFEINAGGFFDDPILDKIKQKFSKQYRTAWPIELIAYYDLQPELPERTWLHEVGNFMEENLPASKFSKVWVYSHGKRHILKTFSPQ